MGGLLPEKAVLVGLITQQQPEPRLKEYLDELEFLVLTAGGNCMKRFVQKMDKPHPATFIGKGKVEEVHQYVMAEAVDMIIFDDELSPAQVKNLEKIFTDVKILDRTTLILDIFASPLLIFFISFGNFFYVIIPTQFFSVIRHLYSMP
jgi:GTP-binding protein HflX